MWLASSCIRATAWFQPFFPYQKVAWTTIHAACVFICLILMGICKKVKSILKRLQNFPGLVSRKQISDVTSSSQSALCIVSLCHEVNRRAQSYPEPTLVDLTILQCWKDYSKLLHHFVGHTVDDSGLLNFLCPMLLLVSQWGRNEGDPGQFGAGSGPIQEWVRGR